MGVTFLPLCQTPLDLGVDFARWYENVATGRQWVFGTDNHLVDGEPGDVAALRAALVIVADAVVGM